MDGLLSFLLFAGLFYFLMRFGCGAHMVHGGHGAHSKHKNQKPDHIDPVCGMEVGIEKGYGEMYEGTLYRFCSKKCLDKFDADPPRYLADKQGEEQ
jgi:YHS domain-containing protein